MPKTKIVETFTGQSVTDFGTKPSSTGEYSFWIGTTGLDLAALMNKVCARDRSHGNHKEFYILAWKPSSDKKLSFTL